MRKLLILCAVVVAGEMVFALPFHTIRFFRPTFLDVFGLSNTELGDLFAVYGIVAMLAYYPGGALADRFPARNLIAASLVATAGGGFYLATIPGKTGLALLYAFWGLSTVFLLWGALIRATRDYGGEHTQGIAFGVLEAGRGVVAVGGSTAAIAILAGLMPAAVETATDAERTAAFRYVLTYYAAATLLAGGIAWLLIPADSPAAGRRRNPLAGMLTVARRPLLWAQAGVIVCAYSTFKGLDNYSLYAAEVLGRDEVAAAALVRDASWLRPLGAIAAGLIADRLRAGPVILAMFAVLVAVYGLLALANGDSALLYFNLFASFLFVFALRGVYFALLRENRTPPALTGAAVGLVSFVGFTPEFFFAPVTGRILDANPGLVGHQNYFWFLFAMALAGVVVTATMLWLNARRAPEPARVA